MRLAIVLIIMLICPALRAAAAAGETFGECVGGLSIALAPKGDAEGQATIVLHNDNPTAVKVQGAFAWLLVAESRDVAFYTDKIPLDGERQELAASGELRQPIALARLGVHAYQKGTKVVDGYPQSANAPDGQSGAGRALPDLLSSGLKAQAIAFVPAGGERITIRSKATTLSLAHAATTQSDEMAVLLERFRHDAFAARDAADVAAAKGTRAIPVLLQGLHDPAMPDFGQLWIATALTRIGGDEAAKAVVPLVADPREGVRDVIAFYGPTMKDQRVDDAILGRARSNQDALFTAWAARGFAEHGRVVPSGLVASALASSEPRARAEVAEVLAGTGDAGDAGRLARLFADENELVRVAAADAVGRHPKQPRAILGAMVEALDRPGESARARIVAALAKCAGRDWQYRLDGPAEQNKAILEQVRTWWKGQK